MAKRLLKRVEKLLRYPPEYAFDDLKRILEEFGFHGKAPRGGSHWIFILEDLKPGVSYETDQITVPIKRGRYVRREYLKKVAKLLNLEEWYEKNKT